MLDKQASYIGFLKIVVLLFFIQDKNKVGLICWQAIRLDKITKYPQASERLIVREIFDARLFERKVWIDDIAINSLIYGQCITNLYFRNSSIVNMKEWREQG